MAIFPTFGAQVMPTLSNNSESLLQLGAGLLGGRTAQEQLAGGIGGFADARLQAKQRNRTAAFLRQSGAADLADGVEQGLYDGKSALDQYYKQKGRYVPIITDGGMTTGGDVCKAFAAGADSVMIGSAFARAIEAPGRGYHWGMATPHANLPRGTRIRVGIAGPLEQILFGPAFTEDGTLNLVGAIRTCMGSVGALSIRELQQTEIIIAPTIKTEGKVFQQAQKLGRPR